MSGFLYLETRVKRSPLSVHALWTWFLLVALALWPITAQGSATSQPTSAPTRQAQSAPAAPAANLLSEGIEKALAGQFDQSLAMVRQAARRAPTDPRAKTARELLDGYLSAKAIGEKQRAEELTAAVNRIGWYCLAQDHQEQRTTEALDQPLRQKVRQVAKVANDAIAADLAENADANELPKVKADACKAIDATQAALKELPKLLTQDSSEYSKILREIVETVAGRLAACERTWPEVESSNAKTRATVIGKLKSMEEDLAEDLADLSAMTGEKPWREALLQARLASKYLAIPSDRLNEQEWFVALVQRIERIGRQSTEGAEWDDALTAYAGLEDLDGANETYRDMVKQARRHVRVLRLYGKESASQPAETDAKSDPEPSWQELVEGADADMVEKAISQLDGHYVKAPDYRKLTRSALRAIRTLAETPQASGSFHALADPAKKAAFLKEIDGLLKGIDKTDRPDHLDLAMALNGVLRASERTVSLPTEVLAVEFTDGFLEEMDEYSSMIWPHDVDDFEKQTMGHFFGVGIQITKDPGEPLKVVTPLAGSPAYKAGVHPGDTILTVDGRTTEDINIDKLVRMITGEKGTKVTLRMRRTGRIEPFDVTLTREEINIRTVRGWRQKPDGSWDYLIDPPSGIGYLRITQFTEQTPADVGEALAQMARAGVRSLIVDLRFNPGGLLRSATDVADEFLRSGCLVSTEGRQTRRTDVNANPDGKYVEGNLVVLVNQTSASAAEILSGAVKDWNRGLIIGQRSYGKGSVQNVIWIRRFRAVLKLTTAFYYLPSGRCLHKQNGAKDWGVDPDIEVRLTPQQIKQWLDIRQKTDLLQDIDDADLSDDLARQYDADAQLRTAVLVLRLRQLQDVPTTGSVPTTATAALQGTAR